MEEEMTNWEWPQYLLAGWWLMGPILAFGFMLANCKIEYQKFAFRQLSIAVLAWVLYMGGFWS